MRISISHREAASYNILRRKGYSINMIARAFGRSTSLVWQRLKFNQILSPLEPGLNKDMRKLPNHVRLLCAQRLRKALDFYLPLWEHWISGTEEKPP